MIYSQTMIFSRTCYIPQLVYSRKYATFSNEHIPENTTLKNTKFIISNKFSNFTRTISKTPQTQQQSHQKTNSHKPTLTLNNIPCCWTCICCPCAALCTFMSDCCEFCAAFPATLVAPAITLVVPSAALVIKIRLPANFVLFAVSNEVRVFFAFAIVWLGSTTFFTIFIWPSAPATARNKKRKTVSSKTK